MAATHAMSKEQLSPNKGKGLQLHSASRCPHYRARASSVIASRARVLRLRKRFNMAAVGRRSVQLLRPFVSLDMHNLTYIM